MKTGMVLLLCALLAACAAAPVTQRDERFFGDRLFAPPTRRISADDVFALSAEMRRYLDREIAELARVKGRPRALFDALYDKGQLRLEYDTEMTRNAAEAFAARSGNCLSLVIMTAAFAKELGLAVEYQKVYVDDAWARAGDVYLAIGHVNLTLGRRRTDEAPVAHRVGGRPHETDAMTIDFLPPKDLRTVRSQPIGEEIVVAMYLNNRAGEALALGQLDDAYWWAREAIVQAPGFLVPYNTLGAIYQRHGNPAEARRVLAHVLEREPGNTQAMANLVPVLAGLGQVEEAQRLAAVLESIDPEPPFSHFKRGMAALRAGDARGARDAFAREVARAPDYHEFQFWLAVAHFDTGDVEAARRHLTLAMQNSTTRRDHDLYAAKLDRIDGRRQRAPESSVSPAVADFLPGGSAPR
ncbi:MAG: tetratricopeptide repeat protein [Betaproteobacteria bacterium]|nr:tetratricopeptide repeat protein [Betaproteobacteria bacterium]